MDTRRPLHRSLLDAVRRYPDRPAVVEPGVGSITYRELDALSDRLRDDLIATGVSRGDRVAIHMRKSIDAVASICGVLKAGATYVPVDPGAPPARAAYVMSDCAVRVALVEASLRDRLVSELSQFGANPAILSLTTTGGGAGLAAALDERRPSVKTAPTVMPAADDLAYILYTSGSTGKPKGVMLSHENAVSFVDWCSEVFQPTADDRFSAHAPFHFDLSILDIHVSLKHGSAMVLVPEDTGKDPARLAQLIAAERISIWYSAPSILSLLAQFGGLERHDYRSLRLVLFAGEVFAVKHIRALCEAWRGPRYFNLYGPTETNVCTYHEVVPPIPADRVAPYPIGRVCSHFVGRVADEAGNSLQPGSEGELWISGRGVMQGYWSLPEQTSNGFFVEPDGMRWYRTGDIVVEHLDGSYTYRGRRDRMVKRRGYRVELGEIEVALYQHPNVKEAAVIARSDAESNVEIVAFLSAHRDGRMSLIEMKRFCSERLPLYMIPDRFSWHEVLPKTSTDKIDYQQLKELA